METLELLAHPVRLRIVHALSGGRTLTTGELCERIPDASKPMIYRHVDLLATAGILEVAAEHRVRGAVERHYRLREGSTAVDFRAMSLDDFRRTFALQMAVLVTEFNAYLDRGDADPIEDMVNFTQRALWLTPAELAATFTELRRILRPLIGNEPTPDRSRYMLSPIIFPLEGPAEES
ncbi:helix-turn-helix domain-containing protein [Nocardia stercoris]|uniref:ArsR family transcriptional regulator n=1 Tax=Nocardia stercoris TaxID=2483361 RepID=A0A3M2L6K2_9NOCA|nr:helix-turn-helix domain-containing protein [Nocardia stercoris]RMI33261.1 ArsR family transcriptional regulator [Nocardia stercoris]